MINYSFLVHVLANTVLSDGSVSIDNITVKRNHDTAQWSISGNDKNYDIPSLERALSILISVVGEDNVIKALRENRF